MVLFRKWILRIDGVLDLLQLLRRVGHPFPQHHSFLFRFVLSDHTEGDDTTAAVDVEVNWFLGLLLLL